MSEFDPVNADLVRSGLRKLGPERCQSALVAFRTPIPKWRHCVLAHAYGKPGELAALIEERKGARYTSSVAAEILGLNPPEVSAILLLFDSPHGRGWLETEVRAVAALAFARVEVSIP